MAERAARLTDGEKESGVAWNEKERRCVVEARGESEKRAEKRKTNGAQSKNKESPNQSAGAEIRKSEGAKSESAGAEIRKSEGAKSESERARNQKACNLPTTL